MKRTQSKKLGLKALNDIYILEEDPMDITIEATSGITKDVRQAILDKRLFVPDAYESFALKFPCTGVIISTGDKTRYKLPIGTRVVFSRLGVMRYNIDGRSLADVKEADIHAVIT